MGIQIPGTVSGVGLIKELQERRIYVSLRGSNLRISFNLFNHEGDVEQLMQALKK
jgi:selenocysteine lyase/cysteine desulfurase